MSRSAAKRRNLIPAALGAVVLCAAAAGWAAVPVEESRATPRDGALRQQSAVDGAAAGGGDSTRLAELFYELQVLKQEVRDLRGMVEEQGHRLERLARDQQEQYLDLDRRMQALRGGGAGGAAQSPAGSPGAEQDRGPSRAGDQTGSFGAGGQPASEREAYAAAFELMKQRRFDASADAFNELIRDYPNGAYTPNAFYWLGELHLAQEQNEEARQAFAQVINLYPDHQKVPDALYKMGVVYHRLGDVERARNYLRRVRQEFPQSSAAGLAETYLAEL